MNLQNQITENDTSYKEPVYNIAFKMYPTFWDVSIEQKNPLNIPKTDVGRLYFNFDGTYNFFAYDAVHDIKNNITLEDAFNIAMNRFDKFYKDAKSGDPVQSIGRDIKK